MSVKRAALVLLLGLPVFAQGLSGGLHVNAVVAVGGLRTDEAGGVNKTFSVTLGGGHLAYVLTPTDEVALVLNGAGWKGNALSPIPGMSLTNDYDLIQVGLDWRHRIGSNSSWSLVGGLNATRVKRNLSIEPSLSLGTPGSTTILTQSGRPGLKGGVSFQTVRWFSVEGSFNHVWLEKRPGTPDRLDSASWLQVSAIFHFGRP